MPSPARPPGQVSLQRRFAPASVCFGCGPANPKGLHLESRPSEADPDELVARWMPAPHHAAFGHVLNGGIAGVLLDCHSNWTAAWHLMRAAGAAEPPGCVTADYAVRFLRPTPTDRSLELRARVVEATADRAIVEATLAADGVVSATCRGTFVAVAPGHPAYERWRGR